MNKAKRIFECLSKKGPETSLMANYFIIGEKYEEAFEDALGEYQCDDVSVLLYSEHKTSDGLRVPMYVDLMDFEHVSMREIICLN